MVVEVLFLLFGMIELWVEVLIWVIGIDFCIGGDCVFYVFVFDYVQVLLLVVYFELINWYRMVFYEMGYVIGYVLCLGCDFLGSFGMKKYVFEELVVEMNVVFCCVLFGIVLIVCYVDYIGFWLEVLCEDNCVIVCVVFQVSKVVDWLLLYLIDEDVGELVLVVIEGRVVV